MIAGHRLFLGAAGFGVSLVLISEGLSLGHHLTRGWLGASWALAAGIALWAFRRLPRDGPPVIGATPMPRAAWAAIGTILAVTGVIALLSPPNTWDSMTYHMSRVAHWSQDRSVANYPTHILRQLWHGPGAEYAVTHLYVLTGGDRLVNLVQWLAFLGCVVGAAIVAGELGAGPRARAVAAIACATLPMAIAQASSTQNDLVASFWLLSLGYWVLRFRIAPSTGAAVLIGVSAGLAGLTKPNVWLVAVPWLLAFLTIAASGVPRRAAGWVVVAGLSVVVLNAGYVGRTAWLLHSGEPVARSAVVGKDPVPPVWTVYFNTTLDPRAIASNALRNVALHLATPSQQVNNWVDRAIRGVHRMMGIDPSDTRTTFANGGFRVVPSSLHEDVVGNPLHLLAGFVAGTIIWLRRKTRDVPATLWAGLTLASTIAFVVAMKWQPFNSRLHLPLFVFLSPLLGVAVEGRRRLAAVCAAVFFALALPSLAITLPRPLIGPGSVLTTPRTAQEFRNRPRLQPAYQAAADAVRDTGCRRVGLVLGSDDWEYPFWTLLRSRLGTDFRIDHVLVENASGRLADGALEPPCALLVVGDIGPSPVRWRGRIFVERSRWTPVSVYSIAS